MALIDKFINPLRQAASAYAGPLALASPWQSEHPHHLEPVIFHEIIGSTPRRVTRSQAIQVAALSRARQLIVSTIPRVPLVAKRAAAETDLPAWLTNSTGALSPFHRMLWTVDDLFFYGWSLWAVDRAPDGEIEAAFRVPYNQWQFDDDGTVMVNGRQVDESQVLLFPGVGEGILTYGAATITEALNVARAIQKAAETPSAQIELHQTNEAPVTPEDVRALIDMWAKARRGENGGVAFTSNGIEVREHGAAKEHLLIEGRNAVAVDIARHAGIPAVMIDATLAGSSLSYSNTSARMAELITFGLSPLMSAISARLSQNDATPDGVTIDFDSSAVIDSLSTLATATTEQGGNHE